MGWPNLGNPKPRAMGDAKAQKAIIRAATAKRVSTGKSPSVAKVNARNASKPRAARGK